LPEFDRLVSHEALLTESRVPAKVRLVFDTHDVNRSGYLDYSELRNALWAMGVPASSPAAASLLLAYDETPDGQLDLLEFHKLVAALGRAVDDVRSATSVPAQPTTSVASSPKMLRQPSLRSSEPRRASSQTSRTMGGFQRVRIR